MNSVRLAGVEINIKLSFFAAALLMYFVGLKNEFMLAAAAVTIHELSHALAAALFGLKTKCLTVTPIGQIAEISRLESLETSKKLIVTLAGPMSNLVIFGLCSYFKCLRLFSFINFSIFLINLLPAYPLDGGRLLQYTLSSRIGILNSNKIVLKISVITGIIFFMAGLMQLILFSYNISLLCMGFYIIKINSGSNIALTCEFYRSVIDKNGGEKISRVRELIADIQTPAKAVINKVCSDYYIIVNITKSGRIAGRVTETEIMEHIRRCGLYSPLGDIIAEKSNE